MINAEFKIYALKAIQIEQKSIKENVGSQDQTAVAFGGLNQIFFSKEKKIEVNLFCYICEPW